MTIHERRQSILDILRKQPGLRVPKLVVSLRVSAIRNDWMRLYWGATLNRRDRFQNNSWIEHHQKNAAAKLVIAQEEAAAFVHARLALWQFD